MPTLAAVAIVSTVATADAKPVETDWARGLVIAEVVGVADRHAPNPAVARGTSKRGAEQAAKKAIARELATLPLVGGGKVGDRAGEPAVKERLDRAVDAAITLAADPETDGAWRVTMAVPIEAVRQAIAGPRALPAGGDQGPRVLVIEGAKAKPAIGWKVGALEAPIVWMPEAPAWAKDAPRAKATRANAGTIEVDGIDASAATLFVIITKP